MNEIITTLLSFLSVPMNDDVVNLDAFEKILAEERTKGSFCLNDQKIYWAMFYTIPIFHNPTGMTLSPGKSNYIIVSFVIDK